MMMMMMSWLALILISLWLFLAGVVVFVRKGPEARVGAERVGPSSTPIKTVTGVDREGESPDLD